MRPIIVGPPHSLQQCCNHGGGGGGLPLGHTPTPSHFPANFRVGQGGGGRGAPGPPHIWLKMTPSLR